MIRLSPWQQANTALRTALVVVCCIVVSLAPAMALSPGVVVASTTGKASPQFHQWQEFRRNVDEKSNGMLLLDYLIFGELGSTQAMMEAVINGRASIGGFGCGGITKVVPELAVPQMPFLFSSDEEANFVFDNYLFSIFSKIFDQHGLVLLHWTEMGWSDFYEKSPIQFPAQLSGQQVRTIGNIVSPAFLTALHATPVEVGPAELLGSSQLDKIFAGTGTVQGYVSRLQPAFKYLTQTHHTYNCGMVVANKAWFESATKDEQAILKTSFLPEAQAVKEMQDEDKKLYAQLSANGGGLIQLTPEQHNAWASIGLPLYPAILRQAGGRSIEVYDAIREGKRAFLHQSNGNKP